MEKMMNVQQAAALWGISARRAALLCKSGRIAGAVKEKGAWVLPEETKKPEDLREKTSETAPACAALLPLPIGISDYRLASTSYYYVDKTLLIRDFLDERTMVSLFTRPRRFGKTLNMDMLRTFFEKTDEDTSVYFQDKAIWSCGERYRAYQGKYPVIFLSFKDVKCETFEETLNRIQKLIRLEFLRHAALKDSPKVTERDTYLAVVADKADRGDYERSLQILSRMLDEHYGIPPVIIIDEYDTPIAQGFVRGFYEKIIGFTRNLFSGGLKDNRHLAFGFLTGILRVAKESIFSGLNNLTVNSLMDSPYSQYFGFTPEEVRQIARYYHVEDKYAEICAWYDGFRFGDTEIFNPWSVVNYFRNRCQPRAYWQSTGSNEIIGEILKEAREDVYDKLRRLLQGESIVTSIDTGVIYPQVKKNPSSIFSFLLMTGYLKLCSSQPNFNGDFICRVTLPNREIRYVYNKEILERLNYLVPQATADSVQEALCIGDTAGLEAALERLLRESVSCYDTAGESFYHGLVLGLCATVDNRYYVRSNRESGEGRFDICLEPRDQNMPGILMELKAEKGGDSADLCALADAALRQIHEKGYDTELSARGIRNIRKFGVAFCGKRVEIHSEGAGNN